MSYSRTLKPRSVTFSFILFLLTLLLLVKTGFTQNNMLILNGGYVVLNGGTATNNINIIINQSNPSGIVRLPAGGHIHSENQYNFIKWLTGTTVGSYVFPFGVGGNPIDYIPFIFNKTAGNNSVRVSTWNTNPQNMPHPALTNVGAVTNMFGADSVIRAVDRFWNIEATSTTADLTFSYRGIENTTAVPTSTLMAQHWNGASWDTQVGPGTPGVISGIGTVGPIPNQTTFSPWTLTTFCDATINQVSPYCLNAAPSNLTAVQTGGIWTGMGITDSINGTFDPSIAGTGIHIITYTLACGDVDTISIVVDSLPTSTATTSICQGDSIFLGGIFQTTTGVYNDTIFGGATNGCDSIIITNLTINPVATGTDVQTACGSFTWIDGNTYTSSTTTPTDTIFGGAANGCDSVVTLNLTINNAVTGTDIQTACNSFTWIDGNTYTASTTTPTDTIFGGSYTGCDSIVTLNLTINNTVTSTATASICQGDSILLSGTYQTTAGVYSDTLIAVSGCDSIITTTLTVSPFADATISPVNPLCMDDAPFVLSAAGSGGIWNGTGITDSISGNFDPAVAGAGTHPVTYTINGPCGDADTTNIVVKSSPIVSITTVDDNCEAGIGEIHTTLVAGTPPVNYSWNNGSNDSNLTNLSAGTYILIISDSTGCISTQQVTIDDLSVDCQYNVYLPNVFSPNGDGENDVLYIRGKGIQSVRMVIYNRWGNKVFETTSMDNGWDGTYRGNALNSAVFVYYIEGTFVNGQSFKEKGNVSIVK